MNKVLFSALLFSLPLFTAAQATLKIVSKNAKEISFTVKGYDLEISETSSNAIFLNLVPDIYEITFYSDFLRLPTEEINIPLINGEQTTLVVDENFNVRKTRQAVDYYKRNGREENTDSNPQPPAQPTYPPMVMDESDLNELIRAVRNSPFGDDKYKTATAGSRFANFTTQQVIKILKAFGNTIGDYKMNFAKETFKKVVDRHNYYKAAEAFTFNSEKEELLNFINTQHEEVYP